MDNKKDNLKFTDLDYLVGDHHLQMIKAALPYIEVSGQCFFSLLIKAQELKRTMDLFESPEGEMGICSLDQEAVSPIDMLNAIKPYGTQKEQDFFDLLINIFQGFQIRRNYQDSLNAQEQSQSSVSHTAVLIEKLQSLLSPEQKSRLENLQMVMQTMQMMS